MSHTVSAAPRAARASAREPLAVAVVAADQVLAQRLALVLGEGGHEVVARFDRPGELNGGSWDVTIVAETGSAAARRRLQEHIASLEQPFIVIAPGRGAGAVREALARGACGVVRTIEVDERLPDAVRAVFAGLLVVPMDAASIFGRPTLSPREKQVLGLVVLGCSNAEIATKLQVTEATVKTHLTSSFRKLGVRTRSEATARILDPTSGLGLGILALTGDGEAAA
jgi:DNA-binding NarL/FixJ family response regulator